MRNPVPFVRIHAALLCSGAAALIYESAWGRLLQRVFGVSDLAIAAVLAAFFLGMGLGSAAGSRLVQRFSSPAKGYALLEILVGFYALISLFLIPSLHYVYGLLGANTSFAVLSLLRLGLTLLVLLPPTILMGATLPVLVAYVVRYDNSWQRHATSFYVANTTGAIIGAGASGLFLVPNLGTRTTVILAALASFVAALLVGSAHRKSHSDLPTPEPTTQDAAPASTTDAEAGKEEAPRLARWLAAGAGFTALAGEVAWTRVLRIAFEGTTQAFAAMLVNFLLGIAIGSTAARLLRARLGSTLLAFATTQVTAALTYLYAMTMVPQYLRLVPLFNGREDFVPSSVSTVLLLSGALLLPLAIATGMAVPLAWELTGNKAEDASKQAGAVLAANTIGGLAGSLSVGFLLVPAVGIDGTLALLLTLHLALAARALYALANDHPFRRIMSLGVPALLAALLLSMDPSVHLTFLLMARSTPTQAMLRGLHYQPSFRVYFQHEGRNTTVTVSSHESGLQLFNDGRPESGFSFHEPGFQANLVVLGGLPTLLARQRERAFVVGLGAGHSTAVLLAGPWRQVTVVELEGAVVDAARFLYRTRRKPFPLDDPRTRLLVDDARTQLLLTPSGSLDAIVSQPSHPWLAGSSALYTQEFFRDARRALRSSGMLSLWVNLFRNDVAHLRSIVATLRSVFPHVIAFMPSPSDFVLCASGEPITITDEFERRLQDPRLRPFVGPIQLATAHNFLQILELSDEGTARFANGGRLLTDDRPALEFELARLPIFEHIPMTTLDGVWQESPWVDSSTFAGASPAFLHQTLLHRIASLLGRPVALQRVLLALPRLPLSPDQRLLLEGAIAELRGNYPIARERYRASGSPGAFQRLMQLELDTHNPNTVLELAESHPTSPSLVPLLAAASIGTQEAARRALAHASPQGSPRFVSVRGVLERFSQSGCEGILSEIRSGTLEGDYDFAQLLLQCAAQAPEPRTELLTRTAENFARTRRIRASSLGREGSAALQGGNIPGAIPRLRMAIEANPALASAVTSLARALTRIGNRTEAQTVLRNGLQAARGLPSATTQILDAFQELGFEISPEEVGNTRSAPGAALEAPMQQTEPSHE